MITGVQMEALNIKKFFLLTLLIYTIDSNAQLLKFGENVTLKCNKISSNESLIVNIENYRSDTLFFSFSIFHQNGDTLSEFIQFLDHYEISSGPLSPWDKRKGSILWTVVPPKSHKVKNIVINNPYQYFKKGGKYGWFQEEQPVCGKFLLQVQYGKHANVDEILIFPFVRVPSK